MTRYRPVLYHKTMSIDCLRVRRLIHQLGVEVELRDVMVSSRHREELQELAGDVHVPCLVLPGTVIADTEQIVKYLRLRYGRD